MFDVNFVLSFDLENNISEHQIGKKKKRERDVNQLNTDFNLSENNIIHRHDPYKQALNFHCNIFSVDH